MALHTEQHPYAYRVNAYGTLYYPKPSDKPEEVLELLKSFTGDKSGWIKNDWGNTPIDSHSDGKGAVFVNAVFDQGDREYYYKLIGKEATDLLLRHHNVRGA